MSLNRCSSCCYKVDDREFKLAPLFNANLKFNTNVWNVKEDTEYSIKSYHQLNCTPRIVALTWFKINHKLFFMNYEEETSLAIHRLLTVRHVKIKYI